jgi:formylglycine-generating enzyme required for sulfatase activity
MRRVGLAIASLVAACSFPKLPLLGDGGGNGSADAAADAPPNSLVVTSVPASFDLHVADTRDFVLKITNPTTQPSGAVTVDVTTPTLAATSYPNGTTACNAGIAPGASCTIAGTLTGSNMGATSFQVTASATMLASGMLTLPLTVRTVCPATCGSNGTVNCCASAVIPGNAPGAMLDGAMFFRDYDAAGDLYTDMTHAARIGDVRLDNYEVTVARFRAFVLAGEGTQQSPPATGAGARTLNGMPNQGGWDSSWITKLAVDSNSFSPALLCGTGQTWAANPGTPAAEAKPINCITWYEAMAFCIWDGGFLPTDAEWNYAAVGGADHRAYPWETTPSSTTIACTDANYVTVTAACVGATDRVGTANAGKGKFGQLDMAGNVEEWVLDWYTPTAMLPATCDNCADLASATARILRGGYYSSTDVEVRGAGTDMVAPQIRYTQDGVRCARPQ